MKQIIFNCLPPCDVHMPSPAYSVLKCFLKQNAIPVKVIYWNLKLYDYIQNFLGLRTSITSSDSNILLPFYSFLALENKDTECLNDIIHHIMFLKPQYVVKGVEYVKKELYKEKDKLEKIIENILQETDWSNVLYIGFSAQFYQWVGALIIVNHLKKIGINVPIVVGGFGSPKEAVTFLKNFKSFDYALWGEGEYPSLMLTQYLIGSEGKNLSEIPNVAYRKNAIVAANKKKMKYVSLDNLTFDIEDYMAQIGNLLTKKQIIIPIESGRGCHWNRCHFCYLNNGYKFRRKSPEKVKTEMLLQISKYGVYNFEFLDNDIIGNDFQYFGDLLSLLVSIRESYALFSIKMAEIITKNLPWKMIKQMRITNFENVQIGYESPSEQLLSLISKKNTFASNLFFLKWAIEFGIGVSGANVIRNLLEERKEHVFEAINNLQFMRFLISGKKFRHNYSNLGITATSRYYKSNPAIWQERKWFSSSYRLFPKSLLNKNDEVYLFYDFIEKTHNELWDVFSKIENFYQNNDFEYSLLKMSPSIILYREMMNGSIINELEFEKEDVHWKILEFCNKEILSLECLLDKIGCPLEILKNAIDELVNERLIYCSQNKEEIMSIINTEALK